jgi:putative holliday junction resolvase
MKYLAVDYGKKRIGLAAGERYPGGLGYIVNSAGAIENIIKVCQEQEVVGIVVGMPSNRNHNSMERPIREFAGKLNMSSGLPIYFEDESFSSSEAESEIKFYSTKKPKEGEVDELAAILILEQFLKRSND